MAAVVCCEGKIVLDKAHTATCMLLTVKTLEYAKLVFVIVMPYLASIQTIPQSPALPQFMEWK